MSITITIVNNITMLVSHNVICFGAMSYGVNEKAPPIVSPPPLSLTGFPPVFFVVLKAILYQPFALIRLLQKIIQFQNQNFPFNLLLVGFDFAFLYMCFLRQFFEVLSS